MLAPDDTFFLVGGRNTYMTNGLTFFILIG